MPNPFCPLHPVDIEEKVQLNLKGGLTLETLRDALEAELFQHKRTILASQVQVQNLIEQISYIDKRIAGRVDPALIEKTEKMMKEIEKIKA
ncbi:MAG: hypothetical protein WC369_02140 [Dehalococcoidales bacterium]|jgi:hypothetical protein